MNKTVTELVVGLTFVLGVLLLGAYTIVITGLSFGGTKSYLVEFPEVYGLRKGDPVRVEGYNKGKVISLELFQKEVENVDTGETELVARIRAVLQVSDDVEIFKDASAVRVTPFSPLGGRVVEIRRGRQVAKQAAGGQPGEIIRDAYTYFDHPQGVPLDQVDVIVGEAEGELLQTLNSLVDDNKANVTNIVENLETVSQKLTQSESVLGYLINDPSGGEKIDAIAANLQAASSSLDEILEGVKRGDGVVGGLVKEGTPLEENVNQAVASGRGSLESLDRILARADRGESAVGVLVSDDPQATGDVRGIVGDVKRVTGKVAEGEGSLGKLVHDERLYEGFAQTGENLASVTGKVDDGQGLLGALLDEETGTQARSIVGDVSSITKSLNDPEAGTLGALIKDPVLRGRVSRIGEEVERLITEFGDSLEDVREQAPVNAFIGAVFAAF